MNQYLTRPDGSLPDGVTQEYLEGMGLTLVRPVDPPQQPGMTPVEGEPEFRDGAWWQTWSLVDNTPTPQPVPPAVTRRQLLLILRQLDIITDQEALEAARTGAVPATIQSFFALLSDADRVAAEITWATMSQCERDHPLLLGLAAQMNLTDAQVDDFFRTAATL